MIDKTAELEEKFNRMEERLKIVFSEVEKRFDEIQQKPEYSFEERIQEIEDLLLLLQLEATKLKEKVGEGLDFGMIPQVPDIHQRLVRVEEELASKTGHVTEGSEVDTRIDAIEKRLEDTHAVPLKVDKHTEQTLKTTLVHEFSKEMHDLEKRVHTLEALLEHKGRQEIEEADSDGVLADIQKILKG